MSKVALAAVAVVAIVAVAGIAAFLYLNNGEGDEQDSLLPDVPDTPTIPDTPADPDTPGTDEGLRVGDFLEYTLESSDLDRNVTMTYVIVDILDQGPYRYHILTESTGYSIEVVGSSGSLYTESNLSTGYPFMNYIDNSGISSDFTLKETDNLEMPWGTLECDVWTSNIGGNIWVDRASGIMVRTESAPTGSGSAVVMLTGTSLFGDTSPKDVTYVPEIPDVTDCPQVQVTLSETKAGVGDYILLDRISDLYGKLI